MILRSIIINFYYLQQTIKLKNTHFILGIIKQMILAQQLNLQHEHSLNHKNSLPGSNPLIPLEPCALHSQSLSLLPCLSNPFFPVSPQEVIKQIAAFITFFSQCELLFVTKEFITCAFPVKNCHTQAKKVTLHSPVDR